MGSLVICCFRPKPGKADELLEVIKTHMPTLRSQDLITNRPATVMRASDGTIIEVFEWKSEEHTARAHENPVVLDMWKRFEACCDQTRAEIEAVKHDIGGQHPPQQTKPENFDRHGCAPECFVSKSPDTGPAVMILRDKKQYKTDRMAYTTANPSRENMACPLEMWAEYPSTGRMMP